MARIVKRLRNGPYEVMIDGRNKSFCGCGFSGTYPWTAVGVAVAADLLIGFVAAKR